MTILKYFGTIMLVIWAVYVGIIMLSIILQALVFAWCVVYSFFTIGKTETVKWLKDGIDIDR